MCIIVVKKPGIDMPSAKTIEACWDNNPDGAGFMYAHGGTVHVRKGYMKLSELQAALDKTAKQLSLKDLPIVLHFRISTHGGVSPANTHPFPVVSNMAALKKLEFRASVAVAHNGIIPIKTSCDTVSDTMEYIVTQMAPMAGLNKKFYAAAAGKKMIENATGSKFAFLDASGHIETIGAFHAKDKLMFSNYGYLPTASYKNWHYTDEYYSGTCKPYRSAWYDDDYQMDGTKAAHKAYKSPLYSYARVSWLQDGDYIVDGDGKISDEIYYIGIGYNGQLYRISDSVDSALERIPGQAYNSAGLPVQFEYDEACLYEVMA